MLTYTVGDRWSDRGRASKTEFTEPDTGVRTNVMYTVSTIVEKWYTPDEWTGKTKRCWGASRVRPGPHGLRFMSVGPPVPYLLHDELTSADAEQSS